MRSPSGRLPIFKALKSNLTALQMMMEFDKKRTLTVNTLNKRHMSPLCKLARQPESEANFQMLTVLLNAKAAC